MSPAFIGAIAGVGLLVGTNWWSYNHGKTVSDLLCKERQAVAAEVGNAVAEKIADSGQRLSKTLEDKLGKLRVVNTTVVQKMKTEREVHHVLSDPACATPVSTIRLRNASRRDPDEGKGAPSEPPSQVPTTPSAPGRQASPPR